MLTVNTANLISAGKMRSDCGDIRFTYLNTSDNKEYEIPYWIESGCNTASTRIWIKVPYIPVNGNVTVYMYYGNPNAVSMSNGSAVFELFTDWESGTLEGWNILNAGGTGTASVVLIDGKYHLKLYAPDVSNRVQANKQFSVSNVGFMIEARHRTGSTVCDGSLIGFSDGSMNSKSSDEPRNGYYYAIARNSNSYDWIEKLWVGLGIH
jgi:Uncharacterized conserved protein